MNCEYKRALQRDDLSHWVIHLTKGDEDKAYNDLLSIINDYRINASQFYAITNFEPKGATCFYEVPIGSLQQLIDTNPSKRKGFGIIVDRNYFWRSGGRPVIYTDNTNIQWPLNEKYRLVHMQLSNDPPIDWSHEREWRIKGDFHLYNENLYEANVNWWWPCVESEDKAIDLFSKFEYINSIYIRRQNHTVDRQFNILNK